MEWTDYPGGSIRIDGFKIGEFIIDGDFQWWGYPPGWRPRGGMEALGPFKSRQEAKTGSGQWLGLDIES